MGVWGTPVFLSDGPRLSKGKGFVLPLGCSPSLACPWFCSLAAAHIPFPALWSCPSFRLTWEEDRHPRPCFLCEHGYKQVLPTDHAKMRNGDLVALVHSFSLSGAVGWMLRVSQSPSPVFLAFFCGRLQWTPAHPSFPPAFPNARASVCSVTTTRYPVDAFEGLLEVVGSVLTSQS